MEEWENPDIPPSVRAELYLKKHPNSVNKASIKGGYNSYKTANAVNLYGFNHTKNGLATALPEDAQGYVFFTRPDLRLSYDNLVQDRQFALMLNADKENTWAWVRSTLDPRGAGIYGCPFVDNDNPFIPILTNNITSLSGWSEVTVDAQTTESGYYNEAQSFADGFAIDHSVRQLNATFKNQIGDPINRLFTTWTRYSMFVHEGVMDPYLNNLVMNIVDYNTRIYRIILDSNKRYIQNIAAIGAGFPLNSQLAAKFDYDSSKPHVDAVNEVSIQFQCMGMAYDDPILMKEFNDLVNAFAPGVDKVKTGKSNSYVKLKPFEKKVFGSMGLPYINLDNGKLDWYVKLTEYNAIYDYLGVPKSDRGIRL